MAMLMPTMAAAGGKQAADAQTGASTAGCTKDSDISQKRERPGDNGKLCIIETRPVLIDPVQRGSICANRKTRLFEPVNASPIHWPTGQQIEHKGHTGYYTDDVIVTSLTQSSHIIGTAPFDKNDAAGNDHDADKGCSRLLWSDRAQPACHSQ